MSLVWLLFGQTQSLVQRVDWSSTNQGELICRRQMLLYLILDSPCCSVFPCLCLCHWESLLVAGFSNGLIRLYSVDAGHKEVEIAAHSRTITALDIAQDSGLVRSWLYIGRHVLAVYLPSLLPSLPSLPPSLPGLPSLFSPSLLSATSLPFSAPSLSHPSSCQCLKTAQLAYGHCLRKLIQRYLMLRTDADFWHHSFIIVASPYPIPA